MTSISRWDKQLKDLSIKAIGELPYAITTLMSRSKINSRWELQPEQRECIKFADELRIATKEGRLKAVFCHVPNEGRRHLITALIMKAMGLIPGSFDYWFIGKEKGCLIEFKRPDEKLPKDFKDNQKHFALWAQSVGVPCYLHNTVAGALESLRKEGLLT